MKFIKEKKKIILGIIIGIITTSNIALAAYTCNASDISYKNNTVEYALNDLNGKASTNKGKYSTEETIIGEWIDGKPIYRKVYHNLDTKYELKTNVWTEINEIDTTNFDYLINGKLICIQPDGYYIHRVSFSNNKNNKIQIQNIRSTSFSIGFDANYKYDIILEYTKK